MIYVYCERGSQGARDLVDWLNANGGRARRARNLRFSPTEGDLIVGWGQGFTPPQGVATLNARHVGNKRRELELLAQGGVSCPQVSLEPHEGWYARRNHHQSANDLLANLRRGDYYVSPEPSVNELRAQVFRGTSFRVARKEPRPGVRFHPTFRTNTGGWSIQYGASHTSIAGRSRALAAARRAVMVLGYDFGAVDVGVRATGQPVVYEVNSAPGLEGNTLVRYGQRILAFARGDRAMHNTEEE